MSTDIIEGYYLHDNGWFWGVSWDIVRHDGSGMVEISFDNDMPNTAYVKGLSVARSKRRRGIGGEMLRLCETIARQEGKCFVELTVEKEQQWLFEWYMRMGYMVLRVEDHLFCMIKVLSN